MEKAITKTTGQNLSATNSPLSTSIVTALTDKQYGLILNTLPRSIDAALECPPIQALVNQGAKVNDLEACLAMEITRVSGLLTVGGNLRQGQSVEIARILIAEYPGESLQDFCLCLRKGVTGGYGDIFRFDILVIHEWFKKYLEEKYDAVEAKLMREKDDQYGKMSGWDKAKGSTDPVKHQEWLDKLKAAVEGGQARQVPDLSDKEVQAEGKPKRKPAAPGYDNGLTLEQYQRKRAIQQAGGKFYKGRTSLNLKVFAVNGEEVSAESQQDAESIIKSIE
jgi:hypothetical protein